MKVTRLTLNFAVGGVLMLAGGAFAIACGDDDDADPTATPPVAVATATPSGATGATGATGPTGATGAAADVEEEAEEFVRDYIDAYNDGDADEFFDRMTDEAVAEFLSFFGMDTTNLEAAKQEAAPFIGEDPIEIEEINVTNATATSATVEMLGSSAGIIEGDLIELTREGDEWKVASLQLFAVSPEIPSDYTTVGLSMIEFAFELEGNVEPGNVAFAVSNDGQQPHEALLARLDEDVNLQEALASPEQPEGVEIVGGVFNIEPGQSYNLIFTDELEEGRYVFVCFFPDTADPAGTPHAYKGMVQEFNIE